MSERKVLNKYYPADYDPSKIPKGKRNRNATFNIRIMAPFNMRCNMCKEYIYKGKKFNSRKEDVMDETYLGLKIFRFYIKCPRCVSEIAFKTDLERTDYTLEAGAKRLFEAEKIAQQMAEEERKAKEEDEMNPMKMLENRTKASRAEMDQIDTLEELREINSKKNQVNTEEMIEKYRKYEELLAQLQMEKEEEEIKDIFGEKGTKVVKRLNDSDSEEEGPVKKKLAVNLSSDSKPTDILAVDSKKQLSQKPQESWQKSVGSLSSKQKLKGLVVKKKPSTLPSVSTTATSNNGQTLDSVELTVNNGNANKSDNDVGKCANIKEASETNTDSDLENSCKVGTQFQEVKSTEDRSETKSNVVSVVSESSSTTSSATSGNKTSALGLIGDYSDSESDSSG
ncbi:splicing factor YJU2-like [Mercenaria mercenaria]|uniref:splicing factor YJU2-like n=1 Tax=Mercenaria mercenaria TaxID=6596 RepID=UPI00234F44AE|nr:splicing factor YJU2-like [Mercenaria mercenaria]